MLYRKVLLEAYSDIFQPISVATPLNNPLLSWTNLSVTTLYKRAKITLLAINCGVQEFFVKSRNLKQQNDSLSYFNFLLQKVTVISPKNNFFLIHQIQLSKNILIIKG